MELVNLVIPQINEKIDNIRGIELGMWSEGLKVAGTSDLVADYEGELAIIDWKTSTYIKKEEYNHLNQIKITQSKTLLI